MCKPCVNWKFESTETWGLRFDSTKGSLSELKMNSQNIRNRYVIVFFCFAGGKLKPYKPILTYAAVWEPTNGFIHFDKIFPHIAYGFRNRTIPIAVYHVRHQKKNKKKIKKKIRSNNQFIQ